MEGEPLDVQRLLYTPEGKPRVSIVSIAHLGDAERMFFVSLLLNEVLGLDARAAGHRRPARAALHGRDLRLLPAHGQPAVQEAPMLTLLKQARAFGLGVVLATQNPVDLDYKGLGQHGTWFIGRLQTERDKARVLDGLEGAAAAGGFDRAALEQTLAGLGNRVFLMRNVHEDGRCVRDALGAVVPARAARSATSGSPGCTSGRSRARASRRCPRRHSAPRPTRRRPRTWPPSSTGHARW
jgi:hypothetical protein